MKIVKEKKKNWEYERIEEKDSEAEGRRGKGKENKKVRLTEEYFRRIR